MTGMDVMLRKNTQIELEHGRGRATGGERSEPRGRAQRIAGGGVATAAGGFPRAGCAWGTRGPFPEARGTPG
jgi:hypothetical protein